MQLYMLVDQTMQQLSRWLFLMFSIFYYRAYDLISIADMQTEDLLKGNPIGYVTSI